SHCRSPDRRNGKSQIIRSFLNKQRIDLLMIESISVDHGVVAQHVNQARDTTRIAINSFNRLRRKQARIATGMFEPSGDVFLAFLKRERTEMMPQGNSLLQLPQLWRIQSLI